jgi:hypothetical protein
MSNQTLDFDPDVTQRNNPAYWAEVLLIAERNGDDDRAALARKQLRRLNKRITGRSFPPRRGAGVNAAAGASAASAGRVSITEKP